MSPDARQPREVRALTGLRFAAATGILLFHFGGQLFTWAPAWLKALRGGGYAWVSLFYVLSGFVLARAHARPMDAVERWTFWGRRLARLYPVYLLAFLLAAPAAAALVESRGGLTVAAAGALSLVLAQAWVPSLALVWNGPGWSTSVVFAFTLAFPWIAARLGALDSRRLAAAGALAWVASLAAPLAWLALQPPGAPPLRPGTFEPWAAVIERHPLLRSGEFVAGVALGLLHARGAVRAPPFTAGLAVSAIGLALASDAAPYLLVHNGLLVPLYAALLLGLASGGGLVGRLLSSRPAVALGEASFALYVLQEPLWRLARALPGAPAKPKPAFLALFVVGAWVCAWLVHRHLERPLRAVLAPAGATGPARREAAGPLG